MSDIHSFTKIFNQFEKEIYHYLVYKLSDKDLAEDLLQEVFLKLWEKFNTINSKKELKGYLYKTAKNLCLNHFRHQVVVRKHQENKSAELRYYVSPSELFEQQEGNRKLLQVINSLPEKTRITFLMSRADNLSYKEISERLKISVKTVENQIGSALKKLRELLSK